MRHIAVFLILATLCLIRPPILFPCTYCHEYPAHPLYEGWCEWCWMHKVPPEADPYWVPPEKP